MTEPPYDPPTTPFEPVPHEPPSYGPPPFDPTAADAAYQPTPRDSFVKRNRNRLIAAVVVVLAIGGGIGWAVSSSASSSPAAAPVVSSAPSAAGSSAAVTRRRGTGATKITRATILSESGSTWSIQTSAGTTLTLTITSKTTFGTKKAPAQQGDFPVGTKILVTGPTSASTLTARRIALTPTRAAQPTPVTTS